MTELLTAWDKVLRCLDALANTKRIAKRCEAKENIIEAIEEYAVIVKPVPQPDQRTCAKCGGTKHDIIYYHSSRPKDKYQAVYGTCEGLDCPNGQQHLHVLCRTCNFQHWEHCADHVEAPSSVNVEGENP